MKKIKALIVAVIALCAVSVPAQAQFKWGIKAGVVANSLKFNKELWDDSNRVGFTGGLTADIGLPFGFGFDASLMYIHRSSEVTYEGQGNIQTGKFSGDYLALPLHLQWGPSLPAVSSLFRVYIFTGPSFSYLLSSNNFFNYGLKKGDVEWDFGVGFRIINHLQISAGYGLGLNKVWKWGDNDTRTNSWTVTLGYLF